jgi:hypothetical protein
MIFPFPFVIDVLIGFHPRWPGVTYWYQTLTKAEQGEADRLASACAMNRYKTRLDTLTSEQFMRVHTLVKGHFNK